MKVKYNYVEFEKPIVILYEKFHLSKELRDIVSKYNFIETVFTKNNRLGLDVNQNKNGFVVYKYGKRIDHVSSVKSLDKFLKRIFFKNKINVILNIACCNRKKQTPFRISRKIDPSQTNDSSTFEKMGIEDTTTVSSSSDNKYSDNDANNKSKKESDTLSSYTTELSQDEEQLRYLSSSFEYVYKNE